MPEIKSLGRYQIKGVLGKGAMGLVYDALDPKLDRRVAIKTILTRTLDEATARHYSMRFKREVRAVARLNHRNIVQVYDFGREGELAYIVMEYIQGKELKDSFDGTERFDLRTVFRLMDELLDALHFAHEAGVVHRDIKPANVMMDASGHPKITDFGVARVQEPEGQAAEATRVGTVGASGASAPSGNTLTPLPAARGSELPNTARPTSTTMRRLSSERAKTTVAPGSMRARPTRVWIDSGSAEACSEAAPISTSKPSECLVGSTSEKRICVSASSES